MNLDPEKPPSNREMRELRRELTQSKRRQFAFLAIAVGALTVVPFVATGFDPFNDFRPGDPVSAAEFNSRFERLADALTSLETGQENLAKRVNTFEAELKATNMAQNGNVKAVRIGTYCGAGDVESGNRGGYISVKTNCERACNSDSARLCTGHELSLSEQIGISIPGGFYASAADILEPDQNQFPSDCKNWTSSSSLVRTAVWSDSIDARGPFFTGCDSKFELLCCDTPDQGGP